MLRTLEGHSGEVNSCVFSPDGRRIVSASNGRTLKVWDVESGKRLATFYAEGLMLCCAMRGEMIIAGGSSGVYFLELVQ